MSLTIGIDVGGTKIAGGVVDEQGRVLEELRVESPAQDAAAIEDAIAGLVRRLRMRHEVEAVGVGAAGYIDSARSTVLFAPNLALRDLDLKAELEERIDVPVVIENDANAAAWGEFRFGAGEDVDDLVLITVGTGVGGGLVLAGRLYRGAFGVAAELGHLRVVPGGRLCGCGNRGCWEQYASGTAMVRTARKEAAAGSMLARPLTDRAGSVEAIDGPMITAAAQEGDPFAIEQLAILGRWLGEGVASLAAVLDPAVVVVGGGVAAAGDLLMTPLRTSFQRELTGRGHRPALEIRSAALGNTAGLIGAADLARERGE
ncbi:MAG: ROK family glucokinase [Nocardioides sp.]